MAVKIFGTLDKSKPFLDACSFILLQICKVFLVATVLLTSAMVAGRFIAFIPDIHWAEEIIMTLLGYMALLASALAIRRGAHIRMVILDKYLPKMVVKVLDVIVDIGVLFVCYLFITAGWEFAMTLGGRGTYTALPWLSLFWRYFPIPIGGFFMFFFGVEVLYNHIRVFFIKEETEDGKTTDDIIVQQLLKKDGEIE